ncbi:glycoside hydrolase family 15 protein [Streptomyces chrestomyceticus]|uniref:glycoside hydrolase family 15 protein n=1 Tax=Streptomyces chrestomyceticus TaxID=68185 RepID=UPI0033CDACE5
MPRLEDLVLIGDLRTAALIDTSGTVQWYCPQRFDAPAVFAALLGTGEHGSWRLGPASDNGAAVPATHRRYRGESLMLESTWITPDGTVQVTDFMPPWNESDAPARLVRIVDVISGRVTVRSRLKARFGYGRTAPTVQSVDGRMRLAADGEGLWLDVDAPLVPGATTRLRGGGLCHDLPLSEGDQACFTLSWQPRNQPAPPTAPGPLIALEDTLAFWQQWAAQCTYQGPHREAVLRALVLIKALTYAPTGAIVAAPTTSLPEEIGGSRNWDYRYSWLRDSAITAATLLRTGYRHETEQWMQWLLRAVADDPENLQIMYGVAGERQLPEAELDWLPGYEGSRPVRIGNGAATQLQHDVYGEVIDTLHHGRAAGLHPAPVAALQIKLVEKLEKTWREPDEGIWEMRGPRRHFVHSKIMAWAAVDRTVQMIEDGCLDGPVERWRALREEIHQEVCEQGYDAERNTFTQSYGSQELDAALLLIPRVGFLPADDQRVLGTIDAIQRELSTADGFVLRYRTAGTAAGLDGLAGDEGAFLPCSFWLADALAMTGRTDEAHALFARLLALRNDLGLLAEEWDTGARRQVGNTPQAWSLLTIVDTALTLNEGALATEAAS